ncbi:MAG: YedE family putative selenium transporter [Angelakisella sp.]
MKKVNWLVVIAGLVVGAAAVLLTALGNPGNMGFCIACFLRDTSGALGLHSAGVVQYIRPEIIGIVLGSLIASLAFKEFKGRGGSSPALRFVLGMFVMVGALMFLGCPLRMMIRIGGGDLNALVGLAGFALGIFVGTLFLKKGFTFKRSYTLGAVEGSVMPAIAVALLILLLAAPAFIHFSTEGPGSMHAPIFVALIVGLIVGALAQRSRLCTAGGLRDAMMFQDFKLLYGFIAVIVAVVIGNLILGKFNLGFAGQPVAHTDGLWNLLGMALVGWASVLLGGCPLRQLILAGEGNSDSTVTVLGMIVGAAVCHNFGLASSAAGPTKNGMIAVVIGFVVVAVVSFRNVAKEA